MKSSLFFETFSEFELSMHETRARGPSGSVDENVFRQFRILSCFLAAAVSCNVMFESAAFQKSSVVPFRLLSQSLRKNSSMK